MEKKTSKPEFDVDVQVRFRFVNEYCKTRNVSVLFRVLLAIISGYVAFEQGVAQGIFSAVCAYWIVLFLLNMYELALVNIDIERQKKVIREAIKAAKEAEDDELSGKP